MGQWQGETNYEIWDDGLTFKPGEDGFTRALAHDHYGTESFDYMGTPNWVPPEDPPEDPPADPPEG